MDVNHYPLSRQLGLALKAKGLKLSAAESCTGGGFSRVITRVPGSSAWFDCSFVTYSNISKVELLGVDPQLIEKDGAVSESVAREMALGALKRSHADIAVSITGIAGPSGGTPEKPVGTVWIGIAKKGRNAVCRKTFFESGRKNVRNCAIAYALKWLIECVKGNKNE
ncbi:CinA family protein [Coxiella burnetii]|uniref:Competence-damage protein n=2 Tax=Coxiella burnetii TaxID=777 RepID=Q83CQ3_COXBU|nr:CinA family protein [Coxiella burnetii]NP_820056.1 putative competence-damage protein [Coxiella burnetii RSA 493]AAO90570.1 putative competence-damage protein [Coxiella burnetii RSA 493]ABS76691.1 putative competence-damage protein [Coxiella burnetii Dugway 5J108-111]ABX78270.1 competence/damage-inducible protein CinA [Coxiella burnetii RSA 331]ACJ18319.1 putative competence-damage protein [Coxiella burnetii CbuG_Q212]ACJ20035.1 putative competence-damage protein [Coxiella burnetii CbuK_Q1